MSVIVGLDSTHNLLFIGGVIGDWKEIKSCWNAISSGLSVDEIHMYKFSSRMKQKALKLLYDHCRSLRLICIKINYRIILSTARSIRPRTPKDKIRWIVNRVIQREILKIISETHLYIELITDKELFDIMGTRVDIPREPIEIADIVAWINFRKNQIPRNLWMNLKDIIIEYDIENKLKQTIKLEVAKIRTRK